MRVRELTISGFRGHSALQQFRFAESFTVVAGINGRGKTAMLDALALLCSRLLPQISPARGGQRHFEPSDVHVNLGGCKLGMKVNCGGIPVEYRLTYDRETRAIEATRLAPALRDKVRTIYGDPHRADDAAPLAVYYTTDRAGYRIPKTLPAILPRGQAAAYTGALSNRTVNFRDFMARHRSAIALEDERTKDNAYYLGDRAVAVVAHALTEFLGGFGNLRVQENPLRLLVDKNGATLDISQLSDGERAFLALVCDLGRRLSLANPLLENPLRGAGVVLIDELELHLHPKWQREVKSKLRSIFPNIQFISTTHSPFVIQSLAPGELINLDPKELGEYADRSIEDIAENVMGVEMPQKSERYVQMMAAAEEYFRLLRDPQATAVATEKAERRLQELSAPFSDDPAFQALLKLEREAKREGEY